MYSVSHKTWNFRSQHYFVGKQTVLAYYSTNNSSSFNLIGRQTVIRRLYSAVFVYSVSHKTWNFRSQHYFVGKQTVLVYCSTSNSRLSLLALVSSFPLSTISLQLIWLQLAINKCLGSVSLLCEIRTRSLWNACCFVNACTICYVVIVVSTILEWNWAKHGIFKVLKEKCFRFTFHMEKCQGRLSRFRGYMYRITQGGDETAVYLRNAMCCARVSAESHRYAS